ncbi:MAG: heparinase II/III family protein, partial [Deltaproteobacteria bacterium]|nr:heparinase II/III family protein [Deltaproteobacteria bacterium]
LSRPGIAEQWETFYHPYPSTGDAERNRASMANYGRIMGLILIGHYGSTTSAQELQAYLSTPPADKSGGFLCHEEFLWFNPDQASHPPSSLTHYSPATGTLLMRSNWPDGAADQDPSATYITFQCGDHFTYHQHYDQNSFTLFKYEDLLVDSGVYSGEGLSYHDINYYIRSIAHNTLVVYNPAEDFSQVRADAVSNDGGQRTVYPASRSPGSLQYFEEHRTHYNTGDMVRFFEEPYYTYAFGDATKAYNNPTYNQAMDAGLMGNVAKVNRFHRELVYLRPRASGGPEYLVLFDRVSVTESAFSGENTKLLFHTLSEPVVNGTPSTVSPGEVLYSGADLATAVSGNGKVFIK